MGETPHAPSMEWRIAPWTNPVVTSKIPIECPCTTVWHNGQFVLKFKSALCVIHRNVEQNMHGMPRQGNKYRNPQGQPARIRFKPAVPVVSGTARASHAVPKRTPRKVAK